ncbi:MAG: membrane dipeptidase [Candidatus Calescibacterium sp.]|nr:membrane dipeptidase [Candidatus Calescibacterium sp.]
MAFFLLLISSRAFAEEICPVPSTGSIGTTTFSTFFDFGFRFDPEDITTAVKVINRTSNSRVSPALRGWVDLHTHPMAHLGFGRRVFHGAPDVDILMPHPWGDCKGLYRPTTPEQALHNCNYTHGGWGFDNGCGNHIRAIVINHALDSKFREDWGGSGNVHGDHHHHGLSEGLPFWPHHSSKLHQQMWWEWLKRARDGGLRVIVALTVNNELLARITNGDPPFDDKSVADMQIDETIRFVRRHQDFMEIAYSAADLRRIVSQNKIAVILGMEVDKWGNFGAGVEPTEEAVVQEIIRLYRKGVRYFFPVHLIDNPFSGTALYNYLFALVNKRLNGYWPELELSADTRINFNFGSVGALGAIERFAEIGQFFPGPYGAISKAIMDTVRAIIIGLEHAPGCVEWPFECVVPGAAFFPHTCCPEPFGFLKCCAEYREIKRVLEDLPPPHYITSGGVINRRGLSDIGRVAIFEMMKLGMLIDIDHMSLKAQRDTIAFVRGFGGYPLIMGHNNIIKPELGRERDALPEIVREISEMGGMFGIGTVHSTPGEFIRRFKAAWEAMGRRAVAIGSDVNGFETLPHHERPKTRQSSHEFYTDFFATYPYILSPGLTAANVEEFKRQFPAITTIDSTPTGARLNRRTFSPNMWDYIAEGGVSHYGLMPEFLFDVYRQGREGMEVIEALMNSAEYLAQTWETAERRAREILGVSAEGRGTITVNLPPIENLCPYGNPNRGDREFDGHGPRIIMTVSVEVYPRDRRYLQATVRFRAEETTHDWSTIQKEWTIDTFGPPAPPGTVYHRVVGESGSSIDVVLHGHNCRHEIIPRSGPVAKIILVGDTMGTDINEDPNCADCDDTRIVRIEFRPIQVEVGPPGERPFEGMRTRDRYMYGQIDGANSGNNSEQNSESGLETSSYANKNYGCSIFSFGSISSAILFSIIILYMLMRKRKSIFKQKI